MPLGVKLALAIALTYSALVIGQHLVMIVLTDFFNRTKHLSTEKATLYGLIALFSLMAYQGFHGEY